MELQERVAVLLGSTSSASAFSVPLLIFLKCCMFRMRRTDRCPLGVNRAKKQRRLLFGLAPCPGNEWNRKLEIRVEREKTFLILCKYSGSFCY